MEINNNLYQFLLLFYNNNKIIIRIDDNKIAHFYYLNKTNITFLTNCNAYLENNEYNKDYLKLLKKYKLNNNYKIQNFNGFDKMIDYFNNQLSIHLNNEYNILNEIFKT